MRALRLSALIGLDGLDFEEVARPTPGDGEVLLRVAATGLNFADLLMTKGRYQRKPALPFTPGLEVAGSVEAAGPGAAFAPGERVVAYLSEGGLAPWAIAASASCVRIPSALGDAEAAALPIAYGSAHGGLVWRADLRAGESLAVIGSGGGVGLAAVEVGAKLGAQVIAVARGTDKAEAARALGASATLDPERHDLRAGLKAFDRGGVDVVFDAVGGKLFAPAFSGLKWGGRHVVVGFAGGAVDPPPRLDHLLVKNLQISGLHWGDYASRAPAQWRAGLEQILAWAAEGAIAPTPPTRWRFDEAIEALRLLERGGALGKHVVTMD